MNIEIEKQSIEYQLVTVYNNVIEKQFLNVLGLVYIVEFCLKNDDFKEDVLTYRNTLNKPFKAKTFPCFYIGDDGWKFKDDALEYPINVCIIDIDGKNNKGIEYDDMLNRLKALPYVSIAMQSIGGNGIWLPILLSTGVKTNEQYKAAYKQISFDIEAKTGLKTDNSCCNINRARFFGYSEKEKCYLNKEKFENEFELNLDLKIYDAKENKTVYENKYKKAFRLLDKDVKWKIERLCILVESKKLDIETSFEDWKALAQSLYNCLNEDGLPFFLRFCKFYVKGDDIEMDLKIWNDIKQTKTKFNVSKIFQLAKKYGLDVSNIV